MKSLFITLLLVINVLCVVAQTRPTCKGTKKDGTPCKSTIVAKATGHCRAHDPAAIRCGAEKKSGGKCQIAVKTAGTRCYHHQKQ